jgi:phenylpropionate dioxygenase-like ring-hydroxylating dioxygenase large terminal subunit
MAEKIRFLDKRYGAYHHRDVPPENALLTHTGPATPAGEYLRRFWQPVAHSRALKDLPVPVTVMHEPLVLFRDKGGRVGLLQKHCAHRGTSLELGKIEERGLRCCYHGWLYDVDGAILEMPNEPEKNRLKDILCQGAYPVQEFGGLVFAYMGPPELKPPFPIFDTMQMPGYRLELSEPEGVSNIKPCNWLQVMDNVLDPVHEAFLHTTISGYQFFDRNGKPITEMADVGELTFEETPIGILAQETRRVGDAIWVRSIECIMPNIAQVSRAPVLPAQFDGGETLRSYAPLLSRWRVPVDDENTMEFAFVRIRDGEVNPYLDNKIAAYRTNYGGRTQEEMQRAPGDYDAQVTQRAIARHALENLTSSDRGVTMFRRMVTQGIGAMERGEDPKGIVREFKGTIPTYANETLINAPGNASPGELKDAAKRVYQQMLAQPVSSGPNPECT